MQTASELANEVLLVLNLDLSSKLEVCLVFQKKIILKQFFI